ncbi:MAG: heavy metal translocating P-type ATPase [Stappiaceae bacterium]
MDFAVDGVHCAGCMGKIERGLSRMDGIDRARLNLSSHRLSVDWHPDEINAETIVEVLDAMGYKAHPFDPNLVRESGDATSRELLRCMAVAGFASMNVMLLSVSIWSGNVTDIAPETRDFFHWLSALIALPAAAYAGRPFFRSAFAALRIRSVNMDVPITIGVLLALALSVLQTIQHAEHAYFDSAIMLLFFLLIGRYLDQNMRRRTRSFAENIAALRADMAVKLLPDGSTREVPLSRVDPGDSVLVSPGERVSVDGIVQTGQSDIDQSLITGETALCAVKPGSNVYAGTLNATGSLKIQVTAATQGTLLDEVNRLLETAAQARSRYVKLADRAAALYAPMVHSAAALTFLGWWIWGGDWQQAMIIAISVLIITCPCALGLAIPAVQVVASGLLYRFGILLNSGDAIERLAEVDTIVFDKTGTLTNAKPHLVNASACSGSALNLAGRLALSSRHPLAIALAKASDAANPLENVQEIPGAGVEAILDGQRLRLGSPDFCGVSSSRVETALASSPGASVLVFQCDQKEPDLFLIEQSVREDAQNVVLQLQSSGYHLEILSGDRRAAVSAVAAEIGIKTYAAELHPQDKIARLDELKASGRTVLMVGDGLNDAPALAAAHVSLSPVTAVQLSQAAADGVFLGERLEPVARALNISILARRAMSQNLLLSTLYNIVAVPIAVAGFVTPLLAAVAMSGSSIIVTANALRLRLMQPRQINSNGEQG